jgi:hypothetical protein
MKRCTGCDQLLLLEAFPRNRATSDGLNRRCRACLRAYYLANRRWIMLRSAAWKAEHPELVRAQHARYRDAHRPELHARKAAYRARVRAKRSGGAS